MPGNSRRPSPLTAERVAACRLAGQRIGCSTFARPADLVAHLLAVQGQDYLACLWALALRLRGEPGQAAIERALDEGAIVRIHALRGTWQLVAPADVRWLLALVGPEVLRRAAPRHRQLGLDAATVRRSAEALAQALRQGEHLTRAELARALRGAGVDPGGERLSHLLAIAELQGLIGSGARRGKQSTHALLEARLPVAAGAPLDRADAIAELARRYFCSRGPASVQDFAWWSGLSAGDARAGLEAARPALVAEELDGAILWRGRTPVRSGTRGGAHLLPAFDEYLVGYQDRDAVLDPRQARRINDRGGMLSPSIVLDGRVIGTWRRELARSRVAIALRTFAPAGPPVRRALADAADRYAAFLGLPADVRYRR